MATQKLEDIVKNAGGRFAFSTHGASRLPPKGILEPARGKCARAHGLCRSWTGSARVCAA